MHPIPSHATWIIATPETTPRLAASPSWVFDYFCCSVSRLCATWQFALSVSDAWRGRRNRTKCIQPCGWNYSICTIQHVSISACVYDHQYSGPPRKWGYETLFTFCTVTARQASATSAAPIRSSYRSWPTPGLQKTRRNGRVQWGHQLLLILWPAPGASILLDMRDVWPRFLILSRNRQGTLPRMVSQTASLCPHFSANFHERTSWAECSNWGFSEYLLRVRSFTGWQHRAASGHRYQSQWPGGSYKQARDLAQGRARLSLRIRVHWQEPRPRSCCAPTLGVRLRRAHTSTYRHSLSLQRRRTEASVPLRPRISWLQFANGRAEWPDPRRPYLGDHPAALPLKFPWYHSGLATGFSKPHHGVGRFVPRRIASVRDPSSGSPSSLRLRHARQIPGR